MLAVLIMSNNPPNKDLTMRIATRQFS